MQKCARMTMHTVASTCGGQGKPVAGLSSPFTEWVLGAELGCQACVAGPSSVKQSSQTLVLFKNCTHSKTHAIYVCFSMNSDKYPCVTKTPTKTLSTSMVPEKGSFYFFLVYLYTMSPMLFLFVFLSQISLVSHKFTQIELYACVCSFVSGFFHSL